MKSISYLLDNSDVCLNCLSCVRIKSHNLNSHVKSLLTCKWLALDRAESVRPENNIILHIRFDIQVCLDTYIVFDYELYKFVFVPITIHYISAYILRCPLLNTCKIHILNTARGARGPPHIYVVPIYRIYLYIFPHPKTSKAGANM